MTRRDCLQVGLGAALGLGLSDVLRLRAQASATSESSKPATSCILVWMDGGPSHYETFDPKPGAPAEIRGEHKPISTKIPGVSFSQNMKALASIADKLAIVRSIRHDQGNHGAGNHYMMTGAPPRIPVACGAFVSFHPSLGSATACERGGSVNNLPAYFSIPRMSRSGGPNFLGAKYAPFVVPDDPNSTSFRVRDVALPRGLDGERSGSRRELRAKVDRFVRFADKAAGDPVLALDEYYAQGYSLVTSAEAQKAFDIHAEPEKVREAYGRNSFGQRALLARRLVEAGVPFVTLYDGGWDHHNTIFTDLDRKLPPFENALAALIHDLDQRGLLETTLVVALGEFGRTPKVNNRGGRDHWSNAMSVLFAGCGTPGGQVVGATDSRGYAAVERILSPEQFAATVYAKLGIDPGKIYYAPNGRPVHLVNDPRPIAELMG
ncbi:MAG TPA: DUF1501 domain-containing protein [Isosphaeraceae bacterium]|nr:DUF1501 domain-containing protein [Isosphaeraceae bacterium]